MTEYTLVKGAKIKPVDGIWPIERCTIPELAQIMFEEVTGRHSSQCGDLERARWLNGMERVIAALEGAGQVSLYP